MSENNRRIIRVVIVDDHELVRMGLRVLLESGAPSLQLIGEADSVDTAVQRARQLRPDVVLMDLCLASGSGVDACKQILAILPKTKVVFLSSYADEESIIKAVLAGAVGFFEKDIASDLLVARIHEVASGDSILSPEISKMVIDHLSENRKIDDQRSLMNSLTSQEIKILKLVVLGKTNKEIARVVGLSDKTVRNYLSCVYQKLDVERRSHAAAVFMMLERENLEGSY